jgi:hypothetical protein
MIVWTQAWLLQVVANIDRLAGASFGVPLVGAAIVDRQFREEGLDPPTFDWPALPVVSTRTGALEALMPDDLQNLRKRIASPWTHHMTRVLVETAAATTSPQPAVPLSAPSLARERLIGFLEDLSAPALLQMSQKLETGVISTEFFEDPPLFPRGTVQRLIGLVAHANPAWAFDIDKNQAVKRKLRTEQFS